ncbi:MAG TPA: hypothetical protein VH684_14665 [Xanthobacteraceae bacterium]|jgi:hypothetical protein
MKPVAPVSPGAELRLPRQTLAAGAIVLAAIGVYGSNSPERLLAYLLILFFALLPAVLWVQARMPGVPVWPAAAGFYAMYFALPIVRNQLSLAEYTDDEILHGAATVALFLFIATASWRLVIARAPSQPSTSDANLLTALQIRRFVLIGLGAGIAFFAAVTMGWLDWLGSFFGLVRSIMLTAASAACYLAGHARGSGSLRGNAWAVTICGLGVMVLISLSSFFLSGAVVYPLSAMFGYVITAKRIPWKMAIASAALISILQAGKGEMREKYWLSDANYGGVNSVFQAPELMIEWMETGLTAYVSGEVQSDVLERASLLHMLLNVQRLTPQFIPFLEGESYSSLASTLVPRFIDPDKPASQVGMNLLNVHYGLQTIEATTVTAIAWGLIPEAYANYGDAGALGIGLCLGLLCGALTRWSTGRSAVSSPTLAAIVGLALLINIEADATSLITTLFQSLMAVFIFFAIFRLLSGETQLKRERAVSDACTGVANLVGVA